MTEHFLTFDSMDRTLKCDHFIGKLFESTLLWYCLFLNFIQFVIVDFALSRVQELNLPVRLSSNAISSPKVILFIFCPSGDGRGSCNLIGS